MERDTGVFEILVVVGAGVFAVVGALTWGGAFVASLAVDGPFEAGLGDAVRAAVRLPAHAGDPAAAWSPQLRGGLPGPALYWSATTMSVIVTVAGAAAALSRLGRRRRVGTVADKHLGVDPHAGFARRRDLVPLVVPGPVSGRFILGRACGRLVATESTAHLGTTRHRRAGDRGAVALVGPSRCGKTTAAVSGILEWDGPAILSSVKADLLGATHAWRRRHGDVQVYDPTGTTEHGGARWTPLRDAHTLVGAQRAARALCEAAPRGGVDGGMDFWLAQAEILLCGLLWAAANADGDMTHVLKWVLTQDQPTEGSGGEVRRILDHLLQCPEPDTSLGALEATQILLAIWEMESRTRSSVYATCQTVVWPWADPGVAAASRGDGIDLEWLLDGQNTLYLCAPIEDQKRLSPAFGGCLNDLVKQIYLRVARTGRPLDPPLLIVIDEAGNTPLRSLPEYASTLAGLGVLLVTIWQSLAQLQASYGRQADTILTNHLTKVFYAGLSDEASLRYVGTVLGDEELESRSRAWDGRVGHASSQLSPTTRPLAPAHVLRQMHPGDALLVHGTLPPAHLRTRPFFTDRALARRASVSEP
jgi:type IV secretion system protein VirD4